MNFVNLGLPETPELVVHEVVFNVKRVILVVLGRSDASLLATFVATFVAIYGVAAHVDVVGRSLGSNFCRYLLCCRPCW